MSSASLTTQETFQVPYLKEAYRFEELRILDQSRTGYALVDFTPSNSKIYWANEAACAWMFKRTHDEVLQMDINAGGVSPGWRAHLDGLYRRVQIDCRTDSTAKTVFFNDEPTTVTISSQPIRILLPGEEAERVLSLDSYCQADAESATKQVLSQHRLASELLYNVECKIQSFNTDGDFELAYRNHFAESFYEGMLPQAYGIRTWLDACQFGDAEERKRIMRQVRAQSLGSPPTVFNCYFSPAAHATEGETDRLGRVWHRVKMVTIHDPNTARYCILVQEFDVTAKVREAELRSSSELKDRFLACVSHELRTPLHGILGLAGSLAANPQCPEWAKRALETMEQSANRLSGLVDDILQATECMQQHIELSLNRINLSEIVASACESTRPVSCGILTHRGEFKMEFLSAVLQPGVQLINRVGQVASVQGDASKVLRVVSHLLHNAAKFTSKGEIEITAHEDDEGVRVAVRDTGCGVAAENIDAIWETFEQGDMSSTRGHGGMGLGLAIVRALVHAHGGTVSVESTRDQPSHGSTFTVTLPYQHRKPPPEQPSSAGMQAILRSISGIERHVAGHEGSGGKQREEDLTAVNPGGSARSSRRSDRDRGLETEPNRSTTAHGPSKAGLCDDDGWRKRETERETREGGGSERGGAGGAGDGGGGGGEIAGGGGGVGEGEVLDRPERRQQGGGRGDEVAAQNSGGVSGSFQRRLLPVMGSTTEAAQEEEAEEEAEEEEGKEEQARESGRTREAAPVTGSVTPADAEGGERLLREKLDLHRERRGQQERLMRLEGELDSLVQRWIRCLDTTNETGLQPEM